MVPKIIEVDGHSTKLLQKQKVCSFLRHSVYVSKSLGVLLSSCRTLKYTLKHGLAHMSPKSPTRAVSRQHSDNSSPESAMCHCKAVYQAMLL